LMDAGVGLAADDTKALRARLKVSQRLYDRLRTVGTVVSHLTDADAAGMARLVYRFGREGVEDAILLLAAHEGREPQTLLRLVEGLHVPDFPIKGGDLIKRGMAPGPEVGKRLTQSVIDANLDAIGKRPKN
jgi:poly(A) polymerase